MRQQEIARPRLCEKFVIDPARGDRAGQNSAGLLQMEHTPLKYERNQRACNQSLPVE
jgi:hypothetical protein